LAYTEVKGAPTAVLSKNGRALRTRAIIQKDDGTKYYPVLSSCITNEEYPFTCSVATLSLATNTTVARAHVAPIQCDDVIRVQVSEIIDQSKPAVWQDIFQGRIMETEARFNALWLNCRGHEEEAIYRIVTSNYTGSSVTTGAILTSVVTSYLTRISDNSLIDTSDSSTLTSYNVKADTKYVADVIRELEELEDYGYIFSVQPHYDSAGNLDATYASWQPLQDTPTDKLKIVEATPRFISAYFKTSISSLVNDVTVYGASGSPQKVGTSSDATSISEYNTRHHVESDTTLTTDVLCSSLAGAMKNKFKDPLVSGQATVRLCPQIRPGDLVYCKIPSLYVNGSQVNGNYRVVRVSHDVSLDQTTLDLGEVVVSSPWQIVQGFHTKNRLIDSRFID